MSINVRTGMANAMDRLEQELLGTGYTRVADHLATDDMGAKQYKRQAILQFTEISRESQDRETIVWRDQG